MEEGKTPPAVPITGFVFVGDEYFLNPAGMKDVINILAGNVTVFNFEEASYDGYLCEKEKGTKVFDKEYDTRSTETVGKNSDVVTVAIRKESGKEMKIMWQRSPELKAIKNCEIKSVQVNRSIQPGETTITWEDRIVVSVQSLLDFYDNKYRMEYDGENEVVYLVEQ